MGATVKIVPDYTIEIPERLRGEAGWQPGQEVMLILNRDNPTPVALHPFDAVREVAKGADPNNYRDRNDRY